ncbi:hypothetical protein, partial [Amaricoccus sp.]|uniref:hypothetical protein n=1 Tax=Amaricoccus sp. TaxID=1872485 RepID=UPI001B76C862
MRHAPALWLTLALAGTMAAAAAAETVVAPGDFEAMAEGRTLHFSLDGAPYGSEQFFPGRRTLWRFAADACQRGAWRADGDRICFAYEGTEGAICWHFIDTGAGHVAALV